MKIGRRRYLINVQHVQEFTLQGPPFSRIYNRTFHVGITDRCTNVQPAGITSFQLLWNGVKIILVNSLKQAMYIHFLSNVITQS